MAKTVVKTVAKKKIAKNPEQEQSRRALIIAASVDIFMENGAAFTKLSEVAKRAKVPAPLIHYYFKDIEDLHYETILMAYENLKASALKTLALYKDDSLLFMKEYIKGLILWPILNPGYFSIWLYFYYMASYSEKFRALDTQIRTTGRDRIALMIYEGMERGTFHLLPGASAHDIAHEVQAILTGQFVLYSTETKTRTIDYSLKQTTNRILGMLGVPPAQWEIPLVNLK
jgi:AcrR family transcriptional regulator